MVIESPKVLPSIFSRKKYPSVDQGILHLLQVHKDKELRQTIEGSKLSAGTARSEAGTGILQSRFHELKQKCEQGKQEKLKGEYQDEKDFLHYMIDQRKGFFETLIRALKYNKRILRKAYYAFRENQKRIAEKSLSGYFRFTKKMTAYALAFSLLSLIDAWKAMLSLIRIG